MAENEVTLYMAQLGQQAKLMTNLGPSHALQVMAENEVTLYVARPGQQAKFMTEMVRTFLTMERYQLFELPESRWVITEQCMNSF